MLSAHLSTITPLSDSKVWSFQKYVRSNQWLTGDLRGNGRAHFQFIIPQKVVSNTDQVQFLM